MLPSFLWRFGNRGKSCRMIFKPPTHSLFFRVEKFVMSIQIQPPLTNSRPPPHFLSFFLSSLLSFHHPTWLTIPLLLQTHQQPKHIMELHSGKINWNWPSPFCLPAKSRQQTSPKRSLFLKVKGSPMRKLLKRLDVPINKPIHHRALLSQRMHHLQLQPYKRLCSHQNRHLQVWNLHHPQQLWYPNDPWSLLFSTNPPPLHLWCLPDKYLQWQ